MKKIIFALLAVTVLATVAFAGIPTSPNKDFTEDYTKLLETHCIRVFVEGTPVGNEYIMGARGSIHFIYLSGTMSELISYSAEAPAWLSSANNDMGFSKRGYSNFIIYLVANQTWVVQAEKFTIGGYHLKKEDILTKDEWTPIGVNAQLADEWSFCVQVPNKYCKPGTEIEIGYGDYKEKFKVPTIK